MLHPRPLRTGRAGFPAARLKQALWRAGPAADSPAAVGVYQVVCGLLAWRAEMCSAAIGGSAAMALALLVIRVILLDVGFVWPAFPVTGSSVGAPLTGESSGRVIRTGVLRLSPGRGRR